VALQAGHRGVSVAQRCCADCTDARNGYQTLRQFILPCAIAELLVEDGDLSVEASNVLDQHGA
jgi:hypothetical protein